MTKAIRSYPEPERRAVIARRIKNDNGGLGSISAKEAMEKIEKKKASQ